MIEWFSSKFAMFIAATIMISSVIGFFKIQHENFKEHEIQSIADAISSAVNTVSSSASELKLRVTFNSSQSGIKLPTKIGGRNYEIEITPNLAIVIWNGATKVSTFSKSICLWNPVELKYITAEGLDAVNSRMKTISCHSYEDFFIANKLIDFPEGSKYLTFVWLERSEPLQREANALAKEIDNFVKTNLNASTFVIKKEFRAQNRISFYRGGIFTMEKEGAQVCGFINYDYLWNPTHANSGTQTTSEYLNETDELFGNGFETAPNDSFWVERKVVELTDIELEDGIYKCKLFVFLYK